MLQFACNNVVCSIVEVLFETVSARGWAVLLFNLTVFTQVMNASCVPLFNIVCSEDAPWAPASKVAGAQGPPYPIIRPWILLKHN